MFTRSMASGPEDERRRMGRTPARLRVRFRSADDLITRYTTDISRGGMFVATTETLPLGASLELALELPDGGEPMVVSGRVVSVLDVARARTLGREAGVGVSFTDDTTQLGERIAAYFAGATQQQAPTIAPVHVLLVEDSSAYRAQIEETLRASGYRVTTAENGLAALGAAVREPPDLVVSDVNMPLMDGWQLVRILRERPATREVPIVFLTTLSGDADRLRGYQLGVDDYLNKPFVPAELARRLRKVLVRARAERMDGSALRGDLGQVSVASLLSWLDSERRSGVLILRGGTGEASVHVAQGRITRVDLPGQAAASLLERCMAMLDEYKEGRFAMTNATPDTRGDGLPIAGLLLEHAQRADEAGR
jgi:uncharacterized protein (TIGR02266 family)